MRFRETCAALLIGAMTLTGCGSSSGSFVFTPNSSLVVDQPFAGQLFLGTGIGGVPITVETLDGQVLASTTTNTTGGYVVDRPLPADFRVVAHLNDLEFSRDIRSFGSQPAFGAITVPTTLVSLLAQARPGATLESLEEDVRNALRLEPGSDIVSLNESVSEDFSHLAFFARAIRNGGVSAYLQNLAASGGSEEPFVLRADTLSASLSSLDPQLAQPLQRFAGLSRVRLSTRRLLSRGVFSAQAPPSNSVQGRFSSLNIRPQFGELIAGAALGLVVTVGNDVVTGAIGALIGLNQDEQRKETATWAVTALQGQFADVEEGLNELSDQISDLQQSVDDIILTINYDNMQNVIATANSFEDNIQLQQNAYIQAIVDALNTPNYFSGEPSTLPNNVANVVATLQAGQTMTELQNDVNQLQGLLTGSSGVPQSSTRIEYQPIVVNPDSTSDPAAARPNLVLIERDNVLSDFGISPVESWARFSYFPYRSAALLDAATGSYEAYTSSQIMGCNLIAEAAHLSATPGQAVPRAAAYVENTNRTLLNVRAQLPSYPLSDNYFVDLPNGLIWYTVLQAPTSDPAAYAQAFDDGLTTGWRIPSRRELIALGRAGGLANPTKFPNSPFGNPRDGLVELGFDLSALGDDNFIEAPTYSVLTNGYYDTNPNEYLRIDLNDFGFADGEDTGEAIIEDSNDPYPFFMCRTIGPTPVNQIEPPPGQDILEDSWPPYFSVDLIDEEIPTLGAFRGFSGVNIPNFVVQFTGNWDVYVGGVSPFEVAFFNDEDPDLPEQTLSFTVPGTPPTYFLTDDNVGNKVSNSPDSLGRVISNENAAEVTTIEYSTLGYDGSKFPVVMSGTVTFSLTSPFSVNLSELTVTPLNITVSAAGQNVNQQFLGQGYFSDKSFQDLTQQVQWSVVDADTGQAPVSAAFSNSTPGLLEITNDPNGSVNLIVTGTVTITGNPSGTATTTSRVRVSR